MAQLTWKHQCESCQLQFKDFKQYLEHRYNFHDVTELQPDINKDDGESSQTYRNNFKTYCKMQIKNFFTERQREKSGFRDSSSDKLNQPLDLSVCSKKTQIRHEKRTEITTTPSCSRNVTGYYSQVACSRYHSNLDDSSNDLFLSLKYIENENVNLDVNPELNTNQPSISSEYIPLEIYPQGMKDQTNRNQSPASERRQMQFLRQGNNENINAIEPSALSGIRQKSECLQQIDTNDFEVSRTYCPIHPGTNEIIKHFNKNEEVVSPEGEKIVIMTHSVNPQSSASERVSSEVRDNDPMGESLFLPAPTKGNEMELYPGKYSENYPNNLGSSGRAIIYRETKYSENECFEENNINVSINQTEKEAQNKASASNSSLEKNSNAQSVEISMKSERSRNLSSNERNQVRDQKHNKETRRHEMGEKNLEENSYSVGDRRSDINKKPNVFEKVKKIFNKKPNFENSANEREEKTFVCEFCEKKFRNKSSLKRHEHTHTLKKKSKFNLSENEISCQFT
ncbi:hypothetical protein TNCT_462191 [Trichonephila clavata]|uniref:C2H2-type domain-containing protein n=1 Tax=Trichonephila clavata TaxID=2740835 RepID=A0A8X6JHX7_TRICU|nr:hypothetical protein TNCT_462191 [Trichonephila clavata]